MRSFLSTFAASIMLMLAAWVPASAFASAYVQVAGTGLTLNGQPFRFVGFNNFQITSMSGYYNCGGIIDQATLDSVLQDASANGATVIRTWFFQSYYQSSTWAAFDRVLNSAAAHGLKVIPVLVDEWQYCEPPSINKDLNFYQSGYTQSGYGYPLSFLNYATTVAKHYASDTRIAFWQIGNELANVTASGTCDSTAESQGAAALRSFADNVTKAIKAVDANHLVSLGTIGSGQCGLAGADYSYVHAGSVDLCEYHDYTDVTHAIPNDGYNQLAQRIAQCATLKKPLFIGEAGIVADVNDLGQSSGTIDWTTLQRRSGFFTAKISAAFANGIAGYLIWDKEQVGSASIFNFNNGRFTVGPNSQGNDPSNAVVSNQAAFFASGASLPTVRFSWEDGSIQNWSVAWGGTQLALSNSAAEAWTGFKSLALTLGNGAGYPAARTTVTTGASAGTKITYRLYLPANAPTTLQAQPYVSNNAWQQTFGTAVILTYGWNVVSWTVPSGVTSPLQAVGVQINNGGGYSGPVYLDDVAW